MTRGCRHEYRKFLHMSEKKDTIVVGINNSTSGLVAAMEQQNRLLLHSCTKNPSITSSLESQTLIVLTVRSDHSSNWPYP